MGITQVFVLALIAIALGRLRRGRSLALLAASVLAIYWLQPVQSSPSLTFWFPTFTLLVIVFSWWLTFSSGQQTWRKNFPALLILAGTVLVMGLIRYARLEQMLAMEASRLVFVILPAGIMLSPALPVIREEKKRSGLYIALIVFLISLLVITKLPSVLTEVYKALLSLRGRETTSDINLFQWLGFSYVVFRLLHTIFDRLAGRFSPMPIAEYVNYVIFFPTFIAGPIDRFERFVIDLNNPVALDRAGWLDAGQRFFVGLFKKFVLADGLAWIALNQTFASDLHSPAWMWLLLYGYSLRIYFDFSGYTDMAIGLGRFLGIRLPENFNAPYLKPNLTQFWNSWHMTLTQWFRSYYFNPVTRALRSSKRKLSSYLVILIMQTSTMVLIGLWHGITVNYLLWGLWHGLGLFFHNRWSDFMRGRSTVDQVLGPVQGVLKFLNPFLTFNFVSLGWLFFILPTPALSWQAFLKLFGVG